MEHEAELDLGMYFTALCCSTFSYLRPVLKDLLLCRSLSSAHTHTRTLVVVVDFIFILIGASYKFRSKKKIKLKSQRNCNRRDKSGQEWLQRKMTWNELWRAQRIVDKIEFNGNGGGGKSTAKDAISSCQLLSFLFQLHFFAGYEAAICNEWYSIINVISDKIFWKNYPMYLLQAFRRCK